MDTMRITTRVSMADAIRRGSNDCGLKNVDIDVSELSEERRNALANILNSSESPLPLSEATPEALLELVDAAIAHKAHQREEALRLKEEAEARRSALVVELHKRRKDNPNVLVGQVWGGGLVSLVGSCRICDKDFTASDNWTTSGTVEGVKDEELLALARERAEELNSAARAAAVDQLGQHERRCQERREEKQAMETEWDVVLFSLAASDEQKARRKDRLLPRKELNAAVRDYLFTPLRDYPRYERLEDDVVEHEERCYGERVEWSTDELEELDAERYAELQTVRKTVETFVAVNDHLRDGVTSPRVHEGVCTGCHARATSYGVLVELYTLAGNRLSREFSL
jgi:hypothetical protein